MDNKIYLRFIIYFILFGAIVAVGTSIVNHTIQSKNLQKEIVQNAIHAAETKTELTKLYLHHVEQDLYSLANNPLFLEYLENPSSSNTTSIKKLFLNIVMANKDYFQLRFINTDGKELIRIDREKDSNKILIVDDKNLQDKSKRYYFSETLKHKDIDFWYSKFDLNVEHEKIEQPLRPTLRIAKRVRFQDKCRGLVIINVDMSQLLQSLKNSKEFNIYLVDKDGYFITHPDENHSWSRYLGNQHTFTSEFSNENPKQFLEAQNYHGDNLYAFSLEKLFKNNEKIHLILQTRSDYLSLLKKDDYKLTAYLALLIFLISIPTGLFIAIKPTQIQDMLNRTLNDNLKKTEIIDKYVLMFTTDIHGEFKSISTAFCNLTGYERSELIGKSSSILKSGNTSPEDYKALWDAISNGKVWSGEIQDKNKHGDLFWLETTILPIYDDNNAVNGYMSISSDITNKKLYQLISEHDKLTNIYNRHKLDKVLEEELLRVQRYQIPFSLIILDIDHFKLVNDTYGHQVGDSVLIELTKILRHNIRGTDTIGRWGGEEFLIICPNTELSGAEDLAEHLRKKIASYDFTTVGHKTSSFGVASYIEGDDVDSLLKRADDNLYKAKESGRNKVVSA